MAILIKLADFSEFGTVSDARPKLNLSWSFLKKKIPLKLWMFTPVLCH